MTEAEATRAAERLAARHFECRRGVTPRARQGFVLRERARLLGQPVPGHRDLPRAVRLESAAQGDQDLAALLRASLDQTRR